MNKQPCYYSCDVKGLTKSDVLSVGHIEGVIEASVEHYNDELLFTATREIGEKELPFKTEHGLAFEWGDPADLM